MKSNVKWYNKLGSEEQIHLSIGLGFTIALELTPQEGAPHNPASTTAGRTITSSNCEGTRTSTAKTLLDSWYNKLCIAVKT